ncbi:hypothetical protein NE237_005079 [Protea cynaroides]|uniref:RING-type domain-containing protein n=1 Tax=Protea cynaroides TaxID=273540 RepID=A0A9Q0QTX9_9MAGN|nr:hypothetical protein NE237_005079 [Protea cynaroides]
MENIKALDNELTCNVCLEQVNDGELICSLPCLHQFHANRTDPWLRQQGTCQMCKFKGGSAVWLEGSKVDKRVVVEVEEGTVGEKMDSVDINPVFLKTSSYGDTLLLILALCFHSVFEGIAIGIAGTKADAWRNLWTICLHKIFAAIAMGIALLRMMPKRPFIATSAYSFAFAISSPVGVGIGIAIDATEQGAVADWIFAISMGIAAGVFVYVAINLLIAKGFKPQKSSYFETPFFKFFAVLLGVGVISVVMIWDD